MSYRLVVTGSRSITDKKAVWEHLDWVWMYHGAPLGLVHGGAAGVDTLSKEWAEWRDLPHHTIPYARGRELGGPRVQWGKNRNIIMLEECHRKGPVVLAAMWDGMSGGTAHCIAAAVMMHIKVEPWPVRLR